MIAALLALSLAQAGPPLVFEITFLGRGVKVYAAELDGRPETREWVVNATWPDERQGLLRNVQTPGLNGGICVGPWYDGRPDVIRHLPATAHLETIHGRTFIMGDATDPETGQVFYFDRPLLAPVDCT